MSVFVCEQPNCVLQSSVNCMYCMYVVVCCSMLLFSIMTIILRTNTSLYIINHYTLNSFTQYYIQYKLTPYFMNQPTHREM